MAVFLILPNRSQEHSPVGTPIVSKIFGNTLLPRTTPFRRASWTTALECVTIRHRHLDAKLLLEGVAQYPYVGPPDVQFTLRMQVIVVRTIRNLIMEQDAVVLIA